MLLEARLRFVPISIVGKALRFFQSLLRQHVPMSPTAKCCLRLQTPCHLLPFSLQVYNTAWHSSWYEFLSDLWTAVGKAHEALASGSERAPGALLTPGSAARAAQQQLLEDAYEFAELCWKSQDSRWEDVC